MFCQLNPSTKSENMNKKDCGSKKKKTMPKKKGSVLPKKTPAKGGGKGGYENPMG